MQVIGLCRFSYLALGGFQVDFKTMEEKRAYLYSPARMEDRFRLFEHVSLPCLREQTDPDFDFVIVTGTSLPREYRDRLHDLTADMPQVRILALEPEEHRPAMARILNEARTDRDAPCLQFRHDDDDAVSIDFIERLRSDSAACAGLLETQRLVTIDYSRGFTAAFGPRGITAERVFRPYLAVGMGHYVGPKATKTMMNFAHHRMAHVMPTITFNDPPMWVRGHNDFNDSRQGQPLTSQGMQLLDAAGEGEFEARFAIDAGRIREAFPA